MTNAASSNDLKLSLGLEFLPRMPYQRKVKLFQVLSFLFFCSKIQKSGPAKMSLHL